MQIVDIFYLLFPFDPLTHCEIAGMYQEYLIMTELGQLLDCCSILPYNNTVTSMIDTFMSNNLLAIQDTNLTGVNQ